MKRVNGYIDLNRSPFQMEFKTIDASPFIDENGDKYLLLTKDQVAGTSSIYIAKLNDDMVSLDYSTLTMLLTPSLDCSA